MKEWISLPISFIIFMCIGVSLAQMCANAPEKHNSIIVIR
jgi:hypothetical protein